MLADSKRSLIARSRYN